MTLSLSDISFSYPGQQHPILNRFSMTAGKGDIIAFQGPSGSGKTTLFRLILGFEKPVGGTITFEDKVIEKEELINFRNRTAWLPQDLDMGEGTLEEVFFYPFDFKNNKHKKPSKEKAFEVFEFMGLKDTQWNTDFRSLSTGQRQRIGIVLCHFLDKEVLILDEPTSALDETSKEKVKELLIHKNKIILSASHDPWWTERCTKIVKINSSAV
ncbi:MAG: ABC transporter ATP-binding protein [Chitinophagaceae bacterium]|nr:ABC transporter ATP-binding protein [Chitinophagaceae bacterium]